MQEGCTFLIAYNSYEINSPFLSIALRLDHPRHNDPREEGMHPNKLLCSRAPQFQPGEY